MKKARLFLLVLILAPIVACGWLGQQEAKIQKENAEQEKAADYVYGRFNGLISLIKDAGTKKLVATNTAKGLSKLKSVSGGYEILKIDYNALEYATSKGTGISGKEAIDKEERNEWWNILRSETFKNVCPRAKFLDNFDAVKAAKALEESRVIAVFMNVMVVYPGYVSDKTFTDGGYVGLIVFIDLRKNRIIYGKPLKAASSPLQISIMHGLLEGGDDSALKEDFRRNIRIAANNAISEISGKK